MHDAGDGGGKEEGGWSEEMFSRPVVLAGAAKVGGLP